MKIINNILIYASITLISWVVFMSLIFVGIEVVDCVIKGWSQYGQ